MENAQYLNTRRRLCSYDNIREKSYCSWKISNNIKNGNYFQTYIHIYHYLKTRHVDISHITLFQIVTIHSYSYRGTRLYEQHLT